MLLVDDIAKSYRGREVVRGVNCHLSVGEVVGLLGPNGAGKTTCFYMIVGLVAADRGRIEIDGKNITALSMADRARMGIGYLPQEPSVFRRLSVEDNILTVLEMRRDLTRRGRQKILESLLEELQVTHLRAQMGQSLSGGERRRVEIARTLAVKPRFIMLDEPFAGVDPITVGEIQSTIAHLKDRGIGVLITDHNVRETLGICDRAYVLNAGQVLAEGSPKQILDHPKVREVYLGERFTL